MSPETTTLVSLLIHVPVVVAWIVFAAFEAAVASPRLLAAGDPLRLVARLRVPTLVLLVVIVVTGTWQTHYNPFVEVTSWETLEQLKDTTEYGMALFYKHIWFAATVALSIATRFVVAPRLLDRKSTRLNSSH